MLKRNRIDKNKGFLFFIEGFAGSGKSSIGIKSYKRINALFGPTIIIHGNQIRDILNIYGYSRIERSKNSYKTRKFIKFITDQNINVIYTVLCLNYKAKSIYKEKIKNFVEIFIDSDVKKIIAKKKKKQIYKLKRNIVGVHIKPQFPKNPDIFKDRLSLPDHCVHVHLRSHLLHLGQRFCIFMDFYIFVKMKKIR